jgi:hypothetical protein
LSYLDAMHHAELAGELDEIKRMLAPLASRLRKPSGPLIADS